MLSDGMPGRARRSKERLAALIPPDDGCGRWSTRIPGSDKAAPVVGVTGQSVGATLAQHREACGTHRFVGSETALEPGAIECSHPLASRLVLHWPEAHDERANSGDLKCTPQSENPLPGLHHAGSGIASGQHGPLDAGEIHRADLLGREDPIFGVGSCLMTPIGSGESESGDQKGILDRSERRRALSLRSGSRCTVGLWISDENEPVRGEMKDSFSWCFLLQRFLARISSDEHRDRFARDPVTKRASAGPPE